MANNILGRNYLLVSTEFKKTTQQLGNLNEFSKVMGRYIIQLDNIILNCVNEIESVRVILPKPQITDLHSEEKKREYFRIHRQETENLYNSMMLEREYTQIKNINMSELYSNHIIIGTDFRAIVLHHVFFPEPYLHLVLVVLKYDFVKKNLYVDIFVSNTQYIKRGRIRQKEFVPKMFDENNFNNEFVTNYTSNIYSLMKSCVDDINMINDAIAKLNTYMFNETKDKIEFENTRILLRLQKNFVEYLSGKIPTDDNYLKIMLSKKSETNISTENIDESIYNSVLMNVKNIIKNRKILENKSYTVIATSLNLLQKGIIYEKSGEEDKHAEANLIRCCLHNNTLMGGFKTNDNIFVIRMYQNGVIGCGLPCQRCSKVLHMNGIHNVIFSIDGENYRFLNTEQTIYTYTTTGNKLLNIDSYLYGDFYIPKRCRENC